MVVVPPLSSPHKDGWRVEHLTSLAADSACGEALAVFGTTLVKGEVSNKIADLLSFATLIVLFKKDAETMAKLKRTQDAAYLQPQRSLGMGSTLAKVAYNFALLLLKGNLGPTVGPTQLSVKTKGGCDLEQWALHMAMESSGKLSATCLDAINAFGEIERDCIKAAVLANPSLYMHIPLFEMLYERESGEMWFYDENNNFVESYFSRSGVHQGCVMGASFFALPCTRYTPGFKPC